MSSGLPAGSSNGATGDDGETLADRQSARDADEAFPDVDQGASDMEHATAADTRASSERDRSHSRADERASTEDQLAAAHDRTLTRADHRASNEDQVAAERELADGSHVDLARQRADDVSQGNRETRTAERAATAVLRAQTAAERLDVADRRDEASRLRDLAAQARDRAAEARDSIAAKTEPEGPLAEARRQAAADRARAAADRERAAADREQAAVDRQQVRTALSEAHLDELTGAYRRGLGTLALQREVNRARHSGGRLVLAFVDVDGLKEVNDRGGHAAGDALLIDVAATIRSKLRSYDPIVRFGGDEFVVAFSDFELERVHARFEDIQSALNQKREGCSISIGLAELQSDDTLDDLTARGDAALYDSKRRKQAERAANGDQPSSAGVGAEAPGPRQRRGLLLLPGLRRRGSGRSSW